METDTCISLHMLHGYEDQVPMFKTFRKLSIPSTQELNSELILDNLFLEIPTKISPPTPPPHPSSTTTQLTGSPHTCVVRKELRWSPA